MKYNGAIFIGGDIMRLKNTFLMTIWIFGCSVSAPFASQIIHQHGDFESVTFERRHYPSYTKKQSHLQKKEVDEKSVLYNKKYDMFLFKKKQSKVIKKDAKKSKTQAAVSSKNPSPQIVDHT